MEELPIIIIALLEIVGGTTFFGDYLSANGGGAGYRTSVYVRPIRKWYWHGGDGGDSAGGGGGGFGKGGNGGDGGYVNPGGGGGYGRGAQYCEYNLGHGKNMTWYTAGYGGGGAGSFRTFASSNYSNGGNGICIVQYYKKV